MPDPNPIIENNEIDPEDATVFFHVEPAEAGQRLDRFLASRAEALSLSLSRTRLKSLIEEGLVVVDAAVMRDASLKVKADQSISLVIPPPLDPVPRGEAMPLAIVFEDEHLIVLDKPAGLVVHPAPGHESGTLVNALIAHCGDSLSGIGGVRRPGIVHRLDKDTSGLLVVAKTDAAHHGLSALFADHGRTEPLIRTYLAFVWGAPERPAGTVDAPLARHKTDREKMAVSGGGREAITHWELLERFGGEDGKGTLASLMACSLETGRTHQIRVHMTHLGHPLLGDPLYGRGFKTKVSRLTPEAQAVLAALDRQALHAATLGFPHPITGEDLLFESELPSQLQDLREALGSHAASADKPTGNATTYKYK
jgi:23S rRNA pseudouridine1911/1915/1917 synthase